MNSVLAESSITCPKCGMTSYNQDDIKSGYCGNCHDWTSDGSREHPYIWILIQLFAMPVSVGLAWQDVAFYCAVKTQNHWAGRMRYADRTRYE